MNQSTKSRSFLGTYTAIGGALLGLSLLACNVENTTPDTGGVGDKSDPKSCPKGVSVVLSDFSSTQVALSSLEGETQSESLISTGSTQTDGVAFALSGDVGLPSAPPASGNVVLLDRWGTNVITWVNPVDAEVLAQLEVGTGFESNPSDYLEVSTSEAFVTRYGDNQTPGAEDFDEGGNILFVDLESHTISGAVSLPQQYGEDPTEYPPRPGAMTRLGDTVWVNLGRKSADFESSGEALLVGVSISKHEITKVLPISGLKDCGQLALSPNGKRAAIACTGHLTSTGEIEDLSESALVFFDVTSSGLRETQRLDTEALGVEGLQNHVAYANDDYVLIKSQTPFGGAGNNRWIALHLETQETTTLIEARPDDQGIGKGIVYGGMSCSPGCSNVCLLADRDRAVLQRVEFRPGEAPELLDPVTVETRVGLPPATLSLR